MTSWFFYSSSSFILPSFSFYSHQYRSFHLTSSLFILSFYCSRNLRFISISSIYPSFSYNSFYSLFFSSTQLLSSIFISLYLAYQILLSSIFSLFTPFTEVLNFWFTEFSSSFCFLSLKIQLYRSSLQCYLSFNFYRN